MPFMRWLRILLVALVVAALVPTAAGAHDHRLPPDPVMSVAGQRQTGWASGEQWVSGDGIYCTSQYGSGVFNFPKAARYRDGDVATIRVRKATAPTSWSLHAWRKLNRHSYPKGQAEPIQTTIVPVLRESGELPRAWDITFTPPPGADHLYLLLDVAWRDEQGCSAELNAQQGSWLYHLRRRG